MRHCYVIAITPLLGVSAVGAWGKVAFSPSAATLTVMSSVRMSELAKTFTLA